MEIFIRNIDWNFTKTQVTDELATILHTHPFTRHSPSINFHVYLHPDKKWGIHNHGGTGTLTLPTAEMRREFLNIYGSEQPSVRLFIGTKPITFSLSKRPEGRPDVLNSIRSRPYVDPRAVETRGQRTAHRDDDDVRVNKLQFGWECRDQVFSIECEDSCEGRCTLAFSKDQRHLRIALAYESETYFVVIPFSHIQFTTVHTYLQDEYAIVFILNTPPTYELYRPPPTPRQRLSFLPIPDHERVAPYASLAIRLVCRSAADLAQFRRLCNQARLRKPTDDEYPTAKRDLFSSFALEQLQTYLRQFNWCVSFQIESIMRQMAVDTKEMLSLIPYIIQATESKGRTFAASLLRKFKDQVRIMFADDDGGDVVRCFLETREDLEKEGVLEPLQPSDGSLCQSYHVNITPTTMFLDGPFPERSNRIIRAYEVKHQESFLRVSFLDEAKLQYRFDREVDGPGFVRSRVGPFLKNGLTIARRTFHFLAYSQSALKEHAVWFVKPFRDREHGFVNAATIIRSIGKFDKLSFDSRLMYCPARYAARISQAFTATDAVSVKVEEIFQKDDIATPDNKYQFTDGVGTLSKDLAHEIWRQLKATKRRGRLHKRPPSAYQIRFMGSKGVLSVDHRLSGYAICLRPSMIKFETPESATQDIEIARAFDRPGLYFLNRPLIMLLEGLGVPYQVFEHYQDMAVEETRRAAQSLQQAAGLLDRHGLGASYRLPSIMLSLERLGVASLPGNTFYEKMLEYAVNHVLRMLKNHARIPIPKAWTLVGVADVHRYLKPNEIFACIKPLGGGTKYLQGPVLISRSPTIHPGDVTIVHAIGRPSPTSPFAVEPLPNTVVFSVLGDRPVPSCLGGGDLDGDVYNLIPLEELPEFTPESLYRPASYDPAPKKLLDRPSTMEDVADFVIDYINSDVLGLVAINWLIIADQSEQGIRDPACLALASLHSDAVDYPKSGQPVELRAIPKLKRKQKPDWNAPETINPSSSGNYYESQRAIGRLFRAIDLPIEQERNHNQPRRRNRQHQSRAARIEDLEETLSNFTLNSAHENFLFAAVEEKVNQFIDTDVTWPSEIESAIVQLFSRYTSDFLAICTNFTLSHSRTAQLSEEEAIIGTIAQKTSQPRRRKDMMSQLRERTDVLVRAIREDLAGDETLSHQQSLERAWIAWELATAEETSFGAQSFGWLALGSIFEAIREIEGEERLE
ncbi:hypothetical protein NLJ89_g906 [Agrocybe chaxingu]|uniref:RNA-dependent RNA polymerase n=1 Tax=Agrocybe chaxingu TaxID=84603 RepID=A0A9W8N128_9AGAR|nr:hypothetical protein NLJ89_g906 [Agrocybe chaxingu]